MLRLLKCLCAIGPIAMAAVAPQTTLAFAPSLNSRTTATTRQSVSPKSPSIATLNNNNRASTGGAVSLSMLSSENNDESNKPSLPVFLDPGTKGGAVVLSLLLFIAPLLLYQVLTGPFGVDEIEAGRDIGVGFTVFTMLLWGASYIFRVATKDMTYAKQLKDYEDAVIAKRLEELDEDEVQALVEDIERDEF
jgi:hypothetical protein